MDDSPLSSVSRPRPGVLQRAVWPALTSVFLATCFAATSAESAPLEIGENHEPTDWSFRFAGKTSSDLRALPTPAVDADQRPPASIDLTSFNERFWGQANTNAVPVNLSFVTEAAFESDDSDPELPGEAAGGTATRRDRAVSSPISVFSSHAGIVHRFADPAVEPRALSDRTVAQARPDLLSGVPEDYAALAMEIAAEEEVDPNWVLSIMRAENARFDPDLVSPAGAVGLMQVMPKIGEAFGAHDLTDPELNIRAGTRFLRLLIDKYRNPVLIASAYNAGEPRVDAHQSLPLIRETADYVTRVVGYYIGKPASSQPPMPGPASDFQSNQHRRSGPTDRARSPMLVFSAASPLASDSRLPQPLDAAQLGGPVKIVKDEVLQ
ncbi:lytic transglycosylase domain-containing protein [Agrobacterium tumefaciens]|uniref:lytic transglycosylase domain-containing protein n=1 Tax=Rhizobium/Agrobacterium group TaxID=227290 RepID=UPI001574C02F|nr:transglycosylase SLT domain-containing protein [Agrobacterium tumefaciens]NTA83900.1 lytic transglycosylase domain-containing protein [Agrobacterium tumefaciens]